MIRKLLLPVAGMLAITLVAFGLGYTFSNDDAAYVQPAVFSWPTARAFTPGEISLDEVKAMLDRGEKIVLLDARTVEEYRAGHIKGALSLPLSQFETRYPVIAERLSGGAEIVVYCSGTGCGLSRQLADALIVKIANPVRVFSSGFPAWQGAGYPVESGGGD